MNTSIGLIGFFDILGYANLLQKNEPEDIAAKVIPVLREAKSKALNIVKETIMEGSSPSAQNVERLERDLGKINALIFSDTILLTMDCGGYPQPIPVQCWVLFLATCIQLQNILFNSGLPLRGVINYGKFIVDGTCFAGRSIVEAYELCSDLIFQPVC